MVLGFCHKSNRKLAWDSQTTTPTPYHILSPGKERKREDKGNEEVQEGKHNQENRTGTDREMVPQEDSESCRPQTIC